MQWRAFRASRMLSISAAAPTRAQLAAIDHSQQELAKVMSELEALQKVDVAKLNSQLKTAGLPVIETAERGAN